MARKWIAAVLALTLALALTACGSDRAGTAAYRWEPNQAVQRQQEARGPLEDRADGAYQADENGRVNGSGQQAGKHMEQAGKDLGQAGKDLGEAARDAADGVGRAAQDVGRAAGEAAKGAGELGKDVAEGAGQLTEDVAKGARDAAQSVGDGAEKALDQATGRGKDAKR